MVALICASLGALNLGDEEGTLLKIVLMHCCLVTVVDLQYWTGRELRAATSTGPQVADGPPRGFVISLLCSSLFSWTVILLFQ